MASRAAARRYAKALFQLAQEHDRVAGVGEELDALGRALAENPPLRDVLLQPLHPAPQRRGVYQSLVESMGLSPLLRAFGSFLIDQRRLLDFGGIHEAYREMAAAAAGRTRARVRSAAPLSEAQQTQLRSALARRVGHDVELDVQVDPGLIGGLVAQVGDLLLDGSLRTQLRQIRSRLD
jgi:F-type H+-transporting ATPase subunit delta